MDKQKALKQRAKLRKLMERYPDVVADFVKPDSERIRTVRAVGMEREIPVHPAPGDRSIGGSQ